MLSQALPHRLHLEVCRAGNHERFCEIRTENGTVWLVARSQTVPFYAYPFGTGRLNSQETLAVPLAFVQQFGLLNAAN
jgi:hypothetical protein